jgi:hypothetical protein
MKTNTAPNYPASATTQSVTSAATTALGDGKSGRYLFIVTGPFAPGTADYQDVNVWLTFGKAPATPVAGTTGFPLPYNTPISFNLGEGVKFMAISDTTTVNLTWSRVSDE